MHLDMVEEGLRKMTIVLYGIGKPHLGFASEEGFRKLVRTGLRRWSQVSLVESNWLWDTS